MVECSYNQDYHSWLPWHERKGLSETHTDFGTTAIEPCYSQIHCWHFPPVSVATFGSCTACEPFSEMEANLWVLKIKMSTEVSIYTGMTETQSAILSLGCLHPLLPSTIIAHLGTGTAKYSPLAFFSLKYITVYLQFPHWKKTSGHVLWRKPSPTGDILHPPHHSSAFLCLQHHKM